MRRRKARQRLSSPARRLSCRSWKTSSSSCERTTAAPRRSPRPTSSPAGVRLPTLRGLGVTAGALGALGAGVFGYLVRRPLPQVEGELRLAGLHAPVDVVRDQWGIPHIF